MITRYKILNREAVAMATDDNGDWVLFIDLGQRLEIRDRKINELIGELEFLKKACVGRHFNTEATMYEMAELKEKSDYWYKMYKELKEVTK